MSEAGATCGSNAVVKQGFSCGVVRRFYKFILIPDSCLFTSQYCSPSPDVYPHIYHYGTARSSKGFADVEHETKCPRRNHAASNLWLACCSVD